MRYRIVSYVHLTGATHIGPWISETEAHLLLEFGHRFCNPGEVDHWIEPETEPDTAASWRRLQEVLETIVGELHGTLGDRIALRLQELARQPLDQDDATWVSSRIAGARDPEAWCRATASGECRFEDQLERQKPLRKPDA